MPATPLRARFAILPGLILGLCFLGTLGVTTAMPSDAMQSDALQSDASTVHPIPRPQFEDAELGVQYEQAVKLIEEKKHKEARKILRKIRTRTKVDSERQAIDRCLKEAEGLDELEDVEKKIKKQDFRWVLAKLDKILPEYTGTEVGLTMQEKREFAFFEVYLLVDDFEPDSKKFVPENPAPEGGGGGGGGGGGRGGPGEEESIGETPYGNNTKLVAGEKALSEKKSLEWKTGSRFGMLTFSNVDTDLSSFRALVLKVRCEDPKKRPQLTVLFDCEDGPFRAWGGRRGGGGVNRRMGFTSRMLPEPRDAEIRLDFSKFKNQGEVTWADVRALRIVSTGSINTRLWIDDIRIERK